MSNIVTRFSPSPTGKFHIGSLRTALFSYLTAKNSKDGKFIIRIEDTSKERDRKEYEDEILNALTWLGIKSDVPIVRQSERAHLYEEAVQKLLKSGHAYYCTCTKEELDKVREQQKGNGEKAIYNRKCIDNTKEPSVPYVVRFRTADGGHLTLNDLVAGKLKVYNREISDPVIKRSDGSVGYLLSNVVDDIDQKITHIIRGRDGVENFFVQNQLFTALGAPIPKYGHIPFVVRENGQKLSKRNPEDACDNILNNGYLKEAVINCVVKIGWSANGTDEIFSMEDLLEKFDITKVGRAPGVFDIKKLDNLNKHYLRNLPVEKVIEAAKPFIKCDTTKGPILNEVVDLLRSRSKTLVELADNILPFYTRPKVKLTSKEEKEIVNHYSNNITEPIDTIAEKFGGIKVVGPVLRKALTGRDCSPPVADVIRVLGREEAAARLTTAIAK